MTNKHSIEHIKIQRDWKLRAIESVLRLRDTPSWGGICGTC